MHDVFTLLRPRLWGLKNSSFFYHQTNNRIKLLVLAMVGLVFWGGILAVSLRVLAYFRSIEELGTVIALKLLSMMLITLLSLLIFSSILTALSKLFLSKDLNLVHALPVKSHRIFLARWIESLVDSAWMVGIYTIPVFISYGIVYGAGPLFYISIPLSLVPLCLIAAAVSACFVMVTVDPQRDTPERLAEYVTYFNGDFLGVTGSDEALEQLTRQLGILYNRVESEPGSENYLVDHTAAVFAIT